MSVVHNVKFRSFALKNMLVQDPKHNPEHPGNMNIFMECAKKTEVNQGNKRNYSLT